MQRVGRVSMPFRTNSSNKDTPADAKENDKNNEEDKNKNEKDFLYHVYNYSPHRLISHSYTYSLPCRRD